jgi:hypothetical protein
MHKHHIVPRHSGGSDSPENIALLTVEEHAEAHRQLFLQFGRWEDELAYKGLLGLVTKEEATRIVNSHTARKTFTGVAKSEEQKRRISESNRGKHQHHGQANPMHGKRHSEKAREIISERMKGKSPCVWYTNGQDNIYILKTVLPPTGYRKGRSLNRDRQGRVI